MQLRIHFSSGRSGVIPGTGLSLFQQAERHAAQGSAGRGGTSADVTVPVSHVQDVVGYLSDLERTGVRVSFMDFHVHGGPGEISIGNEAIFSWRRTFGGRGLESLFSPGARIEFHGCNVADGADGEAFLADCAWTMLRYNGGSAMGGAAYQLAYPGAAVPLNPGREVTAEIDPGGHVVLRNARWLIPTRIRARHRALSDWLERARRRRRQPEAATTDLESVDQLLSDAARLAEGHPTYRDLALASNKLDAAARVLRRLDPSPVAPTHWGW